MCLESVQRVPEFTGYKVMGQAYRGPNYFCGPCYGGEYEMGVWYTSGTEKETDYNLREYIAGFHIFTRKEAAAHYCESSSRKVVRVKYRHVLHKGKDNGCACVVALQMKIVGVVGNAKEVADNERARKRKNRACCKARKK